MFFLRCLSCNCFRVYKPFVVRPVYFSTLKNRRVTGKMRLKIVNSRTKNVKWNRFCTQTNHCVKMVFWLAVMVIVLNVACFAMVKRTAPTVQMKTVVVSTFLYIHIHILFLQKGYKSTNTNHKLQKNYINFCNLLQCVNTQYIYTYIL